VEEVAVRNAPEPGTEDEGENRMPTRPSRLGMPRHHAEETQEVAVRKASSLD
jgi:hypothetical protein